MEGDGGVSTKKKCIEDGSCNFRGRRVIELDVLARALDSGCRACGKALQLSNCHDETISGLGSFLYIICSDPECGEVSKCVNHKHRIVPPVLVAVDQFFIKTPNLLQVGIFI